MWLVSSMSCDSYGESRDHLPGPGAVRNTTKTGNMTTLARFTAWQITKLRSDICFCDVRVWKKRERECVCVCVYVWQSLDPRSYSLVLGPFTAFFVTCWKLERVGRRRPSILYSWRSRPVKERSFTPHYQHVLGLLSWHTSTDIHSQSVSYTLICLLPWRPLLSMASPQLYTPKGKVITALTPPSLSALTLTMSFSRYRARRGNTQLAGKRNEERDRAVTIKCTVY